jgi:pseudouridine-5'-phosphate glycosidase
MTNGSVFAVPIPEKYEAAGEKIQKAVEQAVAEADQLSWQSCDSVASKSCRRLDSWGLFG